MKEITLELRQFGVTATQARYRVDADLVGDRLVHSLTALFASEEQRPYVVETPAGWWDHFRLEVFPKFGRLGRWALKRWPLKVTRHEIGVRTVYPYLKTQLPLSLAGERVILLVNDASAGSFMPEANGLTPVEWPKKAEAILFSDRYATKHLLCSRCQRPMFEVPLR